MAFDEGQVTEIRDILDQRLEELGLLHRYDALLPRYDKTGASTGRISCKEPNYSNPPRSGADIDFYLHMQRVLGGDDDLLLHSLRALEGNKELRGRVRTLMMDPALHMHENKPSPDVQAAMGGTPRPRYSLVGVTLHRSYNGSMLTTGLVVKAVAYTAEEAKALTTQEMFEECGGTMLWIDLTTGQAATDV
jgi:hypothetical protein